MSTNSIISAIVVVIVLIGGYFIFSQPSARLAEGSVKVGVIAPLTGDAAPYGEPLRNMLQLAAEEINRAGGINGEDLVFIFEDGKCTGKDAANAMQKLANVDRVQVVIGGFCSGEALAAEPIATEAKVALFSASASSPALTGKSPYFARNYPSDSSQGAVLAEIAADKGFKTVAVIQEQNDYAAGIFGSFNAKFEALGGKTVKEEFASKEGDFRSPITKLMSQKPDALFVIAQTQEAERVLFKQLKELGWKGQLFINDIPAGDAELLAAHSAFLEGAITAEFTADKSNPKFQEMLSLYTAKYGVEPTLLAYAQTEWDAAFIVADAIRAVGYDGTKISSWIRTKVQNRKGAAGSLTIGADGDPLIGHKPEIVRGGKVVPYTK